MKILAYTCILLSVACSLHAQKPAAAPSLPPLPPGPLIKNAPDPSQWVVTIKEGSLPKPGASPGASPSGTPDQKTQGQVMRIGVTKMGKMRHEVRAVGAKVVADLWIIDGFLVSMDQDTKAPVVAGGGNLGSGPEGSDFPGLDWVSEKDYVGLTKVGQQDIIIFKGKAVPMDVISGYIGEGKVDAVAYVDLATRLPISMQCGGETYTVQLSPQPPASLTPPPEIANAIAARRMQIGGGGGPARPPVLPP